MPATANKTFYDVLGVSKTATQDEIRKAYLKLAQKYHPDKTGGDQAAEAKLKEVNEAYDTLKKPEKRREYDAMLENPFGAGMGGGAQQRGPFEGFQGESPFGGFQGGGQGQAFEGAFEDLFGNIFGQQTRRASRAAQPGVDMEVALTVSLQDVAEGAKKTIRISRDVACKTCGGSGGAPGAKPEPCRACGGTGALGRGNAAFFMNQTCTQCGGAGQRISTPCPDCGGAGRTKQPQTVTVNIPGGAEDGMRLRLAGQGGAGAPGAPAGDLYVVLKVQPDPRFERQGADLVCEAPVSFADAALGSKVRVQTLKGEVDLTVPAGSQPGQHLRLRGLGLPRLNGGGKGDQLVRLNVEVPKRLNKEQKELVRKLRELEDSSSHPKTTAFRKKMNK
jgi:molecular chaperone DnaJ